MSIQQQTQRVLRVRPFAVVRQDLGKKGGTVYRLSAFKFAKVITNPMKKIMVKV